MRFNFRHACMFKIRNTGITDKQGFQYTCYIATSTENLKEFRNASVWTCSHTLLWTYEGAKIKLWLLNDFWPDCVAVSEVSNR